MEDGDNDDDDDDDEYNNANERKSVFITCCTMGWGEMRVNSFVLSSRRGGLGIVLVSLPRN